MPQSEECNEHGQRNGGKDLPSVSHGSDEMAKCLEHNGHALGEIRASMGEPETGPRGEAGTRPHFRVLQRHDEGTRADRSGSSDIGPIPKAHNGPWFGWAMGLDQGRTKRYGPWRAIVPHRSPISDGPMSRRTMGPRWSGNKESLERSQKPTAHGSRYWMSADGMTFMAAIMHRYDTSSVAARTRSCSSASSLRFSICHRHWFAARLRSSNASRNMASRRSSFSSAARLRLMVRIRSLHPRWLFSHAPFTLLRSVTGLPQASHTGGFSLPSMPIPRGFPYGLSRYRAKTHLNTSHDLRMTPFSASPNGVGARRAWLSFGDVGFSGLLVSGSFSGLLGFLAWLWCGCLFFWFFLLGLSFCVFLCPGFVGSGFFGSAGFCLVWFRVPGGRGTPGAWFRRGSYPVPVRGF